MVHQSRRERPTARCLALRLARTNEDDTYIYGQARPSLSRMARKPRPRPKRTGPTTSSHCSSTTGSPEQHRHHQQPTIALPTNRSAIRRSKEHTNQHSPRSLRNSHTQQHRIRRTRPMVATSHGRHLATTRSTICGLQKQHRQLREKPEPRHRHLQPLHCHQRRHWLCHQ